MTRSAQQTAQMLADALTEARNVYTAQQENAASARQSADSMHQRFMSFLHAKSSEAADADPRQAQQMRATLSSANSQDRLEAMSALNLRMSALNLRWEQALADSQLALMRLYAFANAQEGCEEIAQILLSLRLLPLSKAQDTASPPRFDTDAVLEDDPQRQKIALALNFMQGMEGHLDNVRRSYDDMHIRTVELLQQACTHADALKQTLNA